MDRPEIRSSAPRPVARGARRTVDLANLNVVDTAPLRPDEPLPLVVTPARPDVALIDWAAGNRETIEAHLLKHGGILFRGFGLTAVKEFESFAQSICPDLFAEYGDLPQEGSSPRIYNATPYPADQTILFHNESSHMSRWPLKQWFFCVLPAAQGGETPIVDCRRTYHQLSPALKRRFRDKKVMYVRTFIEGLDVSWQNFFKTDDRAIVEAYCREAGMECEWLAGDRLRTREIRDVIVRHPRTGDTVFFHQLQLHHSSCLEPGVRESMLAVMGEGNLPRDVRYGDGSAIEDSVIDEIGEMYSSLAVTFTWERGDILLVDNMLTAHARWPYVGPRKIVVAMGEMVDSNVVAGVA